MDQRSKNNGLKKIQLIDLFLLINKVYGEKEELIQRGTNQKLKVAMDI
jgi:hypothetical protein